MNDAHNHLQHHQLHHAVETFTQWSTKHGIRRMIVNGTSQKDWQSVVDLSHQFPTRIRPSFGLHPWWIADRSHEWLEQLDAMLTLHPNAAIGECGLDKWIENHDIDDQRNVFKEHLSLATKHQRPITIHCLKAWGSLIEILQSRSLPECGFLVHAFSGSMETARELVKLGAYFSFSGYFLHPRKSQVRDVYAQLPVDRLLIETDAPSMALPMEKRIIDLPEVSDGTPVNHPANLVAVHEGLASLRNLRHEELDSILEENFTRLFGF